MAIVLELESALTRVYNGVNAAVNTRLAGIVPRVRAWMQYHKARRDSVRARRIARILNFRIAGEEVVTVPNLLSVLRPILALIIMPMRLYGVPTWIVATVFAVAMLTDKLDGAWALLDGHTRFGEILDPICDKFALMFIVLPDIGRLHWPAIALLLTIEAWLLVIVIAAVYAIHRGKMRRETKLTANIYGKTKFTLEVFGMSFLTLNFVGLASTFFMFATPFALASAIRKTADIAKR